jgi:adenylosuccinate synthase
MRAARAVIGANFGDEGKGLVVDYLCSRGAGCVVRFNGGAQAGHTVVTPGEEERHVFHHVGSGAFHGVPTYLSRFFVCNPLAFLKEWDELQAVLGVPPRVFAHPQCLVTTFADMIINQAKEDMRGADRHGSVGMGLNETVNRSQLPHLSITMADLWNDADLRPRLREICGKYAAFRMGDAIPDCEEMIEAFCRACRQFAGMVHPLGIEQCPDPVFEGAQGLLLDQDNKEFYPHVTRSKTGMHNVRILCKEAGIDYVEAYYVSRTYLTRHGAGPLPNELIGTGVKFHDDTNCDHPYQGPLRFGTLDRHWAVRCSMDAHADASLPCSPCLVLTHCDQLPPPRVGPQDIYAYGPTRNDITTEPRSGLTPGGTCRWEEV